MSADLDVRPAEPVATDPRRRTRTTWLVAAAAVAAIAAGGAFAVSGLTGNDAGAPQADHPASSIPAQGGSVGAPAAGQTTQLTAGSDGARCAQMTPAILGQYDQAFEGTVTSVEGDTVTFETTDVYNGQVGETVVLTAPPAGVAKLINQPSFVVGQPYLVSAYQGAVSMCGYSGAATPELQSVYEKAFVR